jgi:outer membrane receptor protein involved in Fe transport
MPQARIVVAIFIGFLTLTCFSPTVVGQVSGGAIVGTVTDTGGGVIPGVTVQARNVATNAVVEVVTGDSGHYEFPLLLAGTYVIRAELVGFQVSTSGEIVLHSGTRPKINLELRVGDISQVVEVVSSAPLLKTTQTDLGVVIDSMKMAELPLNGRTFTQLMSLQNGVNERGGTATRGGVEVNGLGGMTNNFMMDGMDMTFGENGGLGIGAIGGSGSVINVLGIEAIQEFQVKSGAFSAEYGRTGGGAINVTTKSGGNEFHGTAFYFGRNDALDANNFFSNKAGLDKPPLRHHQFGGNVGGPIIKDKLFFFFNYEGSRITKGQQITGNVPTPLLLAQLNPGMQDHYQFQPKDFNPTSNPFVGRHERTDALIVREDTTLTRIDATLGKHGVGWRLAWNDQLVSQHRLRRDMRRLFPIPLKNWAAFDSFTISPTMFNEVRVGYNHYPISRHFEDTDPDGNEIVLGNPLPKDTRSISVSGLTRTFWFNVLEASSPTYSFIDNFVWVRGDHTLKVGVEYRDVDSIRNQTEPVIYYYNDLDDLIADKDGITSTQREIQLSMGNPGNGFDFWTLGLYIQDDWRVSPRLQLNLGLRYEYYNVFKGPYGLATGDPFGPRVTPPAGIWDPDRNNFGPRIGIVFDPTGESKSVVRVGFGITYMPPMPMYHWDEPFIDPAISQFPFLSPSDFPAQFQPIQFGDLAYFPGPGVELSIQEIIDDPTKFPEGLAAGANLATRSRRDQYTMNWNLSVQHSLTRNMSAQASYVGNRSINLHSDRVLNELDPTTGIRPNAEVGPGVILENAARLWHHGLQLALNKQFEGGYGLDAYYTWSKTMQYANGDGNTNIDRNTQDWTNYAGSVGPKRRARASVFTLVHSLDVPTPGFARDSAVGRGFLGGWTVQGIMGARSGEGITIENRRDNVGLGRSRGVRPDAVPGVDWRASDPNPLIHITSDAFDTDAPKAEKRFGNLGTETARGRGNFTWDLGIHKNFHITEGQQLTFRLEMFNWLNHPIFNSPTGRINNSSFGIIRSAADGRDIQVALKYIF